MEGRNVAADVRAESEVPHTRWVWDQKVEWCGSEARGRKHSAVAAWAAVAKPGFR